MSFDDNGNPLNGVEVENTDATTDSPIPEGALDMDEEVPSCFINAAALSEPEEEPCTSSSLQSEIPQNADKEEASRLVQTATVKLRVPISKSYPDIIQTTLSPDDESEDGPIEFTTPKRVPSEEKSVEEVSLMIADSLEDLHDDPTLTSNMDDFDSASSDKVETPKGFEKPIPFVLNPIVGKYHTPDSITNSTIMTESVQSGIFSEKPPEAWVVDLNAISMDASGMMGMSKSVQSTSSSAQNSLAFFVDINELEEEEKPEQRVGTPDKKIFSMFVDLEDDAKKDADSKVMSTSLSSTGSSGFTKKSSRLPLHKGVTNVQGKESEEEYKKRFPSPLTRHKMAAENARKFAQQEYKAGRMKVKDESKNCCSNVMKTSSIASDGDGDQMARSDSSSVASKGLEAASNRSSLHVANVLDNSFCSSILSSMDASVLLEADSCQSTKCLKLGNDLLRMFQEEINTDVNIVVSGRVVKAHKCILASRSQYFAAILSGNWVEQAGNTIKLDGFSYNVVQFTMYHIYSGTNEIPDTIDLIELATLTDLLGLEGLRENISQTIRTKFCHNFHRPCTGCITGVLECFPIAVTYGMDELHRKMTKWTCRHFVRIWPCKAFATLGEEHIEKCLNYSINHLSVDNILDHTLGCDQLLTTMPSVRWTEPIFEIVHQLADACVQFIGENFSQVLQNKKFLLFGKGQTWNIPRIEETFMKALALLKPDEACLSHAAINRLIELGTETIDEVEWSSLFVDFLKTLKDEIEKFLLGNASKAVLSKNWETLDQKTRKKICATSFVGYDKTTAKVKSKVTTKHAPKPDAQPTRASARAHSNKEVKETQQASLATTATIAPTTKVASVRPMQVQLTKPPHKLELEEELSPESIVHPTRSLHNRAKSPVANNNKPSRNNMRLSSSRSTDISTSSEVNSDTITKSRTRKTLPLEKKEHSFTGSTIASRNAAAATNSASRTPVKPLTPVTPSRPSPILGQQRASSAPKSRVKSSKPLVAEPVEEPRKIPPNKVFMSNSARAAAVSKPQLKCTVKPSGVTSKVSCGLNKDVSTTKPRERKNSNASNASLSARSSFSNVEKPSPPSSRVRHNASSSNTGHSRKNSSGGVQHNYGHSNNTNVRSNSASTRPAYSNARKEVPKNANRVTNANNSAAKGVKGRQRMDLRDESNHGSDDDGLRMGSPQRKQIDNGSMSRSTIETETGSGEPKVRTLAEIGRSSTFSKDEPTVLGKMDNSAFDFDDY